MWSVLGRVTYQANLRVGSGRLKEQRRTFYVWSDRVGGSYTACWMELRVPNDEKMGSLELREFVNGAV